MDILATIQAEISRKRKQIEQLSHENVLDHQTKFIRRADLEKQSVQDEPSEKQSVKEEPQQTLSDSISLSVENNRNKESTTLQAEQIMLSEEEFRRRLRSRGEPVRLFGETMVERYRRLKQAEALGDEAKQNEGQRNVFMDHIQKVDSQLQMEDLKRTGALPEAEHASDSKLDALIAKYEPELGDISVELMNSNLNRCLTLVFVFWKRLLREWEKELNDRPMDVKRSTQGKLESANQKQTVENMKPFFKMCKKREVDHNVLARVSEICQYVHQREYLKANDSYLRLSIGNAPWPIGVTSVGIHERSARERIFSNQVAHVLNDETQRKWVQSFKRLMTFAQKKYPPEDIAKLVG